MFKTFSLTEKAHFFIIIKGLFLMEDKINLAQKHAGLFLDYLLIHREAHWTYNEDQRKQEKLFQKWAWWVIHMKKCQVLRKSVLNFWPREYIYVVEPMLLIEERGSYVQKA